MNSQAEDFYVYTLSRPNGVPFYVGKGKGRRMMTHEAEARRGHDCEKCRLIREIWASGHGVRRAVVFRSADEGEAFEAERQWIEQIGAENLVNVSEGGSGPRGVQRTPEQKERLRAYWTGRRVGPRKPEHLARISAGLKGHVVTAATRAKLAAARRGKPGTPHSDATRALLSAKAKERYTDPETRARLLAYRPSAPRVLTPEQVREIRQIYASGAMGLTNLAKRFNVNRLTIRRIVRRETYKEVGDG